VMSDFQRSLCYHKGKRVSGRDDMLKGVRSVTRPELPGGRVERKAWALPNRHS
jgi:hypothetical protein